MKKAIGLLVVVLMIACVGGFAFAHCGNCGIVDGYVCAQDNVAQVETGKCGTCGADLAKADVKEVKDADGKVAYEIAPAPAAEAAPADEAPAPAAETK